MREHNVYRGRVISLHGGEDREITVHLHHLPQITRAAVVLPEGSLERLERHAIGVAAQAQRLTAAGRQLKRGVLLTTNRPDLIEPALATRPGRVDLALQLPLPDEGARTRLVTLYAEDIPLDDPTQRDLVARTDGLTGAFIKELMRQAALRAALDDRAPSSADATAALDELLE